MRIMKRMPGQAALVRIENELNSFKLRKKEAAEIPWQTFSKLQQAKKHLLNAVAIYNRLFRRLSILVMAGRVLFTQYFVKLEDFGTRLKAEIRSVQRKLRILQQEPAMLL